MPRSSVTFARPASFAPRWDPCPFVHPRTLRFCHAPSRPPPRRRRAGYAKTPDVKLDLPIGIRDPAAVEAARRAEAGAVAGWPGAAAAAAAAAAPGAGVVRAHSGGLSSGDSEVRPLGSTAPRIVHWIDSKAMFGDPLTHRDNLEQVRQREWGRVRDGEGVAAREGASDAALARPRLFSRLGAIEVFEQSPLLACYQPLPFTPRPAPPLTQPLAVAALPRAAARVCEPLRLWPGGVLVRLRGGDSAVDAPGHRDRLVPAGGVGAARRLRSEASGAPAGTPAWAPTGTHTGASHRRCGITRRPQR
jgi:hypothetical protein